MHIDQFASDHGYSDKHRDLVQFSRGWQPGVDKPVHELQEAFTAIEPTESVGAYCKRKKIKAAVRDQVLAERNWLPESESGTRALDAIFAAAGADVSEPPADEAPAV